MPLVRWKELCSKGKAASIPLMDDNSDEVEEASEKLKQATELRDNAKTNEEKLAAAKAVEEAKVKIKKVRSF